MIDLAKIAALIEAFTDAEAALEDYACNTRRSLAVEKEAKAIRTKWWADQERIHNTEW